MGAGLGRTREVNKPLEAFLSKAIEPFVSGLATDTIELAEFGEVEEAALIVSEKTDSFFHGGCVLPGHGIPPRAL